MTLFDNAENEEYAQAAKDMQEQLLSVGIRDIFVESFNELKDLSYEPKVKNTNTKFALGIAVNRKIYTQEEADKYPGTVVVGQPYEFNHMHVVVPRQFIDMTEDSAESTMARYRDAKQVFKRFLDEISLDTMLLVKDLQAQGSLMNALSYMPKLEVFIDFKKEYDEVPGKQKDNWCWIKSYDLPYAKFKNELMGSLLTELAEGKDLNEACLSFNKRSDPTNYMKAKSAVTPAMRAKFIKEITELGYPEESFVHEHATIDDIRISEILFSNMGDEPKVSIFDQAKVQSTRHKRAEFNGIPEIGIEKFMTEILPSCTGIEVFLENRLDNNLVVLLKNTSGKHIHKWDNQFSWTYSNNLTGKSMIKDAVKDRGGNVEADVAIRLHFPDTTNDYDLYVREPNGHVIYYGNRRKIHASSGCLDLDAQGADGNFTPDKRVENITYTNKHVMPKGAYEISVNNHPGHTLTTTFYMEIEIEGEVTQLKLKQMGLKKPIAAKLLWDGKEFQLQVQDCMEILESKTVTKEIWGLETNKFHKVNLVCLSPNYWQQEAGNKHYFFFLDGCKHTDPLRGIHPEFLNSDLVGHRKFLDYLGATLYVQPGGKQLSGIGFNATVPDELVVKLLGTHKRTVKIKF